VHQLVNINIYIKLHGATINIKDTFSFYSGGPDFDFLAVVILVLVYCQSITLSSKTLFKIIHCRFHTLFNLSSVILFVIGCSIIHAVETASLNKATFH